MSIDEDIIKSIAFFKDVMPYEKFKELKPAHRWKVVNTYYRWQLLKRNEAYIRFYGNILSLEENNLIRNNLANEKWGISDLLDPNLSSPPKDFHFGSSKNIDFSRPKRLSLKDINNDLDLYRYPEEGADDGYRYMKDSETIMGQIRDELYYFGNIDHGNDEDDTKRFLLLALDLKTGFSEESLDAFIKFIRNEFNEFKKNNQVDSPDEVHPPRSMLDFEKNLFIYDHYKLHQSPAKLRKEFALTFGEEKTFASKDLSAKIATVQKHISYVRRLPLRIDSLGIKTK